MNMNFFAPVNIVTGKGCIGKNTDEFKKYGKKCIIVTGKYGAKSSGALGDVVLALESVGTEYIIFDRIEQNPSYASCKEAAEMAKEAMVKEMWLTHYSPSLVRPQDYEEKVREIFPNTIVAKDRRTTTLLFEEGDK